MKKAENKKMKQLELFTNNWGVNSGFESLRDKLNELIPAAGKVANPMSKNKHLEKFRRAQNAAYDFFNNGLCNKRGLFVSIFAQNEDYYIDKWNIPTMNSFRYFTKDSWKMWEDNIEKILTPIIIAAAKEQGVK
tara:strand:+ start:286 stop:687 length:402 start_codon:yes stop_codon:yes gene_type:complete